MSESKSDHPVDMLLAARLESIERRLAALEAARHGAAAGAAPSGALPPAVPVPHEPVEPAPDETAFGVLLAADTGGERPAPSPAGDADRPRVEPPLPGSAAPERLLGDIGGGIAPAPTEPASKRAALKALLRESTGQVAAAEGGGQVRDSGAEAAPSPSNDPDDARGLSVESLVGGRWFAWLGALAVVVAIALFLKLAYDSGYLKVPPAWRCGGVALFGFLLMGVGEFARRRVSAWASAGLTAAGVASVYAAVLAAFGLFNLIAPPVAFVLLSGVSALGVALAARANLAPVALISIAGAYAAPFIIGTRPTSPVVFPLYLLAVLGAGLVLSAWKRGTWTGVGRFTWWGTMVLGGVWSLNMANQEPLTVLAFLGLTWAAVHTAHFAATRGELAPEADTEQEEALLARRPVPGPDAIMVLSSFSVTGWAAGLAVYACMESGMMPGWVPAAGGVGVTLVLALWLCGALGVLVDVPRTGRERLGAALALQSGALLIAAVALGVSGRPAVPVWIAMGLAAVAGGAWIRAKGVQVYGLVVMGIGAARLLAYDSWIGGLAAPLAQQFGLVLSWWMLMAVLTSAAWWAATLLIARATWAPRLATLAASIAMLLAMASTVHRDASGPSVAITWLALGLVAVSAGGGRWAQVIRLEAVGLGAIALATLRILALDWPSARGLAAMNVAGLRLTAWSASAALSGCAWLVAGLLIGRRPSSSGSDPRRLFPAIGAWAVVLMLMLAPLSRGVDPAAVLWAWIAIGGLAVLFSSLAPVLRFDHPAAAALLVASGQWALVYLLDSQLDWSASRAIAGLHPGLIAAVLLAGALAWLGATRMRGWPVEIAAFGILVAGCLAVLLVWAATSLEVARVLSAATGEARVRKAAISIWWALFAAGLVGMGFWRRVSLARHAGLALMAIAAGKVVIVDLAGVPQGWRILSFLMLGLLMLGVAFGYARATALAEKAR